MNITHQPCPFCDSTDAFSYDKEKNAYGCFSCRKKGRYTSLDNEVIEGNFVPQQQYKPKAINGVAGKYVAMCGIT